MRTTIEITDAQRGLLLELAAERGTTDLAELVREAIDRYLTENAARRERIQAALAVLGTFSGEAADVMEESLRNARATGR